MKPPQNDKSDLHLHVEVRSAMEPSTVLQDVWFSMQSCGSFFLLLFKTIKSNPERRERTAGRSISVITWRFR